MPTVTTVDVPETATPEVSALARRMSRRNALRRMAGVTIAAAASVLGISAAHAYGGNYYNSYNSYNSYYNSYSSYYNSYSSYYNSYSSYYQSYYQSYSSQRDYHHDYSSFYSSYRGY